MLVRARVRAGVTAVPVPIVVRVALSGMTAVVAVGGIGLAAGAGVACLGLTVARVAWLTVTGIIRGQRLTRVA